MYKQTLLLFLSIVFVFSTTHAQKWTNAEFTKANTAANSAFLSNEEKNVIMYMNLIRLDGEKFYYTFLEDYINTYNAKMRQYRNYNELRITRNNPYYISLLKHMKSTKNLPMFFPNDKLTTLSKNHAIDLDRNNLDTHESSNGDHFNVRLSKYFPNRSMSENIDFGFSNSLDIVCHLLLDCGVPSLGHRFNIIDQKRNMNLVGVSIQPHPSYTWCAVIDFVAEPGYSKNE
ncbi:CAP domain-containing protein [Pedobacter sp. AW1-32]|uniref:CAP domain-containing protein n=1 Tax=Pedobacter sp. AW1-32 TaxID=3383026 RepID=UPI003FEF5F5F